MPQLDDGLLTDSNETGSWPVKVDNYDLSLSSHIHILLTEM